MNIDLIPAGDDPPDRINVDHRGADRRRAGEI